MAVEIDSIQNDKAIGWADAQITRGGAGQINVPRVVTGIGNWSSGNVGFQVDTNSGFYNTSANFRIRVRANGTDVAGFRSDGLYLSAISFDGTDGVAATILQRDSAGVLALRNATNAQAFNVYNTFTNDSNYERGFVRWNSNELVIGTEFAGTGASRVIRIIRSGGTSLVLGSNNVECSGHFHPAFTVASGSIDLGVTSRRWKDILLAGQINHAPTWNDVNTTFTGYLMNVTDTASAAGSLLMDLQVGGTSRFGVSKEGAIVKPSLTNELGIFCRLTGQVGGLGYNTPLSIPALQVSATTSAVSPLGAILRGDGLLSLGGDAILVRDAANTLALRNGVNAQAFNIYNTFTDASNYERGFMRWVGNIFQLGTQASGTGSARSIEFVSGGVARMSIATTGTITFGGTLARNSRFSLVPAESADGSLALRSSTTIGGAYLNLLEVAAPNAPGANQANIYVEDDGSGKTRLMIRFATGAAQQIAIEP